MAQEIGIGEVGATKMEHVLAGSGLPARTGDFDAAGDDLLAGGFDDAAADIQAETAEVKVVHAVAVGVEVVDLGA